MGVCVTERVMNYDSGNGILPLMGGTGPIRSIVNRENVSRDVEGLERVYDIISVLPQQRYGAESLGSVLCPRGLKSHANTSKNLQRGVSLGASFFSGREGGARDSEAAWRAV